MFGYLPSCRLCGRNRPVGYPCAWAFGLGSHGYLGSFQQLNDAESSIAIREGPFTGLNTVHEMLAGHFQSFGLVYFGTQHIANPVLHECLAAILVLPKLDAFVENL